MAKDRNRLAAGEPLVERLGRHQPEAVAVGVELGDVHGRAERIVARVPDADPELTCDVLDQLVSGHLEGAVRHLGHRIGEAGVRQRAHVVEVQGVGRADLHVGLGPVGAGREVARRGLAQLLSGTSDLGGAELHVVLPDRLGVEGVGERGDQRLRRRGRGGPGVQRLRVVQQRGGPGRVRLELGAERERRRDPAGQVGADRLTGGCCVEDRSVRDVAVLRIRVVVVGLGKPPQVVVAGEGALLVAGPDADLQVQGPGRCVPHLAEPREAVTRLGEERCGRPAAEQPGAGEEDDVVVRRRVGELQVVAGVGPAALDVHRTADPGQVAVRDEVLTPHHVRPRVDVGVRVVQVRGLAVQRSGDLVVAVALALVERDAVADHRRVELVGVGDPERR